MRKEQIKSGEKIGRLRIPDGDMPDWIKTLRESDMTEEQIERMLIHLNRTFAEGKGVKDIVEKELEGLKEYLKKEHGRELTDEQEEYLRKSIETRLP
jgi:hypothetical protein